MKNGKTPGSDGLTAEFYKIFWQDLKEAMLINSFNHSFQINSLSEIQKQGLITLLPKSSKDLTNLSNWRPISLLNVDYKIMTKAIANRIKTVLKVLIDSSQTGFIKGRYIGENIRLLFDIIEYTEENNIPGLLLFTDFEKAFDSINHEYISKILDAFNFGQDIKSWINLFYNSATSCVLYNGYTTEFFPIQRGVRQGCPLSPYIFILAIELLSLAIRQNDNIRGINIFGKMVKITLFADDCTNILDGSELSYNTTIYLFEEFGKLSGLNLNFHKCVPLKIGSLRNIHDLVYSKKKELIWNKDTAKALGIYFHSHIQQVLELNYKQRIENFRNDITIWKKHKLTTIGNITVFKSFILSKLTFLFSVLPDPPQETLKSLKQQSFELIWNNKRDKIKRDTITKPYEDGGLRMVDLNQYLNSINITWVKRFADKENTGAWKLFYVKDLSKNGGLLLFQSNLAPADIKSLNIRNSFLNDILYSWCSLNYDNEPKDINSQILWNNSHIKNVNKPLAFLLWIDKGISYVKNIFDYPNKRIKTFAELQNEFDLPTHEFLNYHKLISVLPKEWMRLLKDQVNQVKQEEPSLFRILNEKKKDKICKYMTDFQTKKLKNNDKTKAQHKWELNFPENRFDWKNIYSAIFDICKDNTLQNFQYNFVHRNIATNKYLLKCKYVASSLCSFCNMAIETLDHLFWECSITQYFWNKLFDLLSQYNFNDIKNKFHILLYSRDRLLSYIYMFAKYYIYQCKFKNIIPNIESFKTKLKNRKTLEHKIALEKDRIQTFYEIWGRLRDL